MFQYCAHNNKTCTFFIYIFTAKPVPVPQHNPGHCHEHLLHRKGNGADITAGTVQYSTAQYRTVMQMSLIPSTLYPALVICR